MSNLWFFRLRKHITSRISNKDLGECHNLNSLRTPSITSTTSSSSRFTCARNSIPLNKDDNNHLSSLSYIPPLRRRTLPLESTNRTSDSCDNFANLIPRIRVEFYVNQNTFRERLQEYLIKNKKSSYRIRCLKMLLKLFACLLYILRVILDDGPNDCPKCNQYGQIDDSKSKSIYQPILSLSDNKSFSYSTRPVNWNGIIWVKRAYSLWVLQTIIAIIFLTDVLLLTYLTKKGDIIRVFLSFHFILELVNGIPFITSIFYPPFRNLFIPSFLHCWIAKQTLEKMFNDVHRAMQQSQSALSQRLTILTTTLLCLIFTSVCGFQHFQRAGGRNVNLFESLYFVVVTFATVGYGDYKPENMLSQLFIMIMICVALIVLPTQFEQLACTWMERQKYGSNYSVHRAESEKHVVFCSTTLVADTVMDFLSEFYAHPLLQDFSVVLLSPCELDTTMKMILQIPMWAQRVIYIQGSALKDIDLTRARVDAAEAVFILAARNYENLGAADEHTILRSWAVRDFAPTVPQYVQIYRPENKIHVVFAEHVVCEDEFKYALLANNCLCPGTSTFVTLLLHTSRGHNLRTTNEEWQRLYGKGLCNEIYHIKLSDSRFFGEYEGKSFTYASFHSHRKYGVGLIGIQTDMKGTWPIMLNPGPTYILKADDICFYMNITKEENSTFLLPPNIDTNDGLKCKDSQLKNVESETKGEPCIIRKLSTVSSNPECIVIEGTGSKKNSIIDLISGSSRKSSAQISRSASNLEVTEELKIGRESSPARIKKAVTELAAKTKKAIAAKSGIHLEVPKMEYGKPSKELTTNDVVLARGRRPSIAAVPVMFDDSFDEADAELEHAESSRELGSDEPIICPVETSEVVKGFPPASPYVGVSPTLCYLIKEKKQGCCIILSNPCEHCNFSNAREYNWQNQCIILAADFASNAIYNFLVPLRAHFLSFESLRPIVLLLERRPSLAFIDAISWFPMVYWMQGSIDNLDDLIRAGINCADSVVVVNKETSNSAEEDYLADCNTIVAVQTMFKMFPSVKIITELSQSSNMRFMQFRAHDAYALSLSKVEKYETEIGSHVSYMFRLPFAAGYVFSASMLDTLLYQSFIKSYMITIIRLLLGIDQAPGSGFLSSMKITKDDLWIRTYGRLYQKLCSTTCEIPIGIYRTQGSYSPDAAMINLDFVFPILNERVRYQQLTAEIERQEIINLVRNRMQDLGYFAEEYDDVAEHRNTISYVIINPSCDLRLEEGDMIYLIRPSPIKSKKTFMTRGNSVRASKVIIDKMKSPNSSPKPNLAQAQPTIISINVDSSDKEESHELLSKAKENLTTITITTNSEDGLNQKSITRKSDENVSSNKDSRSYLLVNRNQPSLDSD